MVRVWKYILWTLLGSIGLLLALVVFLLLWIDPNDYRDDISKLAKDEAGLILDIKGDIGWSLYPTVGFSVAGVSLATAEGTAPLATVGKAAVGIALLPLFSKQVTVRTLFVDGLVVNLVVDENGKGNWEALTTTDAAATPEPTTEAPAGEPLLVSVPKIVITNTLLDYDDRQAKTRQKISLKKLVAEDIALAKEFPLHLVATVEDNTGLKVEIDTRAFLLLDMVNELYGVRALDFKGDIAGILAKPFHVTLAADIAANMKAQTIAVSNLSLNASDLAIAVHPVTATVQGSLAVDLAADTATIGPLEFSAAAVTGNIAMDVKNLTKEIAYVGTLTVAPFNAKQVMRSFDIEPPTTQDQLALTKVALKTAIDGTLTRAMLNNLDITLDDTHIRGSAGIADVATSALVFDLALDAINADRYLPPPAPATTAAAPAAASTAAAPAAGKPEPLLPVEMLRTLNIDGKFTAEKITLMEWDMGKLAVAVRATDGDIRIAPLRAQVLEGTVSGEVQIDARGAEPRIVTRLKLDRIEVGGVVKRYAGRELFRGKTSLNLNLDTTGNDADALLKKAVGSIDLTFADALLKGMNLGNVLNETLTKQLGAFSMLVPDYQQKLPQEMQQDTAFKTLTAATTLKDGIAHTPAFGAGIKDGSVRGSGQFNLLTMAFDYTLAVRTDKLKDSKYFANTEFPVRCQGNASGNPTDWCRPDTAAIGNILKNAAGKAVGDRLKNEVGKQLGIDSTDTGALKEEAQQRLEAEKQQAEQQAKEKAKEQANKELGKALKKLF